MPYKDQAKRAEYQRQRRMSKAKCAGCGNDQVTVRHKAAPDVESIPLCSDCMAALRGKAGGNDVDADGGKESSRGILRVIFGKVGKG